MSLHYLMSKNGVNLKYALKLIEINDKSQGNVAKHVRNDDFYTHLSFNLLVKEFLKLVNIWQSYRQNGDCFIRPNRIALLMLISPDKLNNLCITDRNCY